MQEHNWVFNHLSQHYVCRPLFPGQPDHGDCSGCGMVISEESVQEASVKDALPFRSSFETLNWIASHFEGWPC